MRARFEIQQEEHDRFVFRFFGSESEPLLDGLPSKGKVTVQLEVQHARDSIRKGDRWARHGGSDGHFAVLHDKNGDVLGRTHKVTTDAELDAVLAAIAKSVDAPLLDRTRVSRQQATG